MLRPRPGLRGSIYSLAVSHDSLAYRMRAAEEELTMVANSDVSAKSHRHTLKPVRSHGHSSGCEGF